MNRLSETLAKEAGLTLSLPRSGFELFTKAGGLLNLAVWPKVAWDQPHNEFLHTATERAFTTGTASALAIAGLAMVIGANRAHEKSTQANSAYENISEQ